MENSDVRIRKALVTGATRGIGYHIAEILVQNGVDVCISGTRRETVDTAARMLGATAAIAVDLEQPDSPAKLVSQAVKNLVGLDLVVNNAGISLQSALVESSVTDWDRIMHINARAPYFICKEALVHLRKSQCPTIVQIASVVSYEGYPLQSAYAASKHALVGFTKSLAKEVQRDGIRVHTISPGGDATDMIGAVRPDIERDALIEPEEIAELIWFLLSHRGNPMIDHIAVRRSGKILS